MCSQQILLRVFISKTKKLSCTFLSLNIIQGMLCVLSLVEGAFCAFLNQHVLARSIPQTHSKKCHKNFWSFSNCITILIKSSFKLNTQEYECCAFNSAAADIHILAGASTHKIFNSNHCIFRIGV